LPNENEVSGAPSNPRSPKPSPTRIGNHQLKPSTLIMGYGFDPDLS
jgi:methionine-gamma-lyase